MTYKEIELIKSLKEHKTLEDYFRMLDRELTEEEKQELAECEDTTDYHFCLGMWIRNTWIYPDRNRTLVRLVTERINEDSLSDDEDELSPPCADSISSAFLKLYKEYLLCKRLA